MRSHLGRVAGTASAAMLFFAVAASSVLGATFSIGGTVSGLNKGDTVVLLNEHKDALSVKANGSFAFSIKSSTGAGYSVTVLTEPAGQLCAVANGSGTVAKANVTSVKVTCANAYTIGGTITGLDVKDKLTLLDNGGDALAIETTFSSTKPLSFTFKTPIVTGDAYKVTIGTPPIGQVCTIANGSGTVAKAKVTNVAVTCKLGYTVGGKVTGLAKGKTLTLLDNGGNALAVNGTTTGGASFTFTDALANKAAYDVTIETQPAGETCSATAAKGTIASKNVTNVSIACGVNSYTIGGEITGLTKSDRLTLLNNGANSLFVLGTGSAMKFTFPAKLNKGQSFDVTVGTQPSGEVCTVTHGSGTVATANVTDIAVACVRGYTVGGAVSGLSLGQSITLENEGGNATTLHGTGTGKVSFTFSIALAKGAHYLVTVSTLPTGESCTVQNGSGTIGTSSITDVAISCAKSYTIGGHVAFNTAGGSVTLQVNGGASFTESSAGAGTISFTAPGSLLDGSSYTVSEVSATPTGETCTILNGTGKISSANVTNVSVTCNPPAAATFSIGGAVSGLTTGQSVVLQDNGGDNLTVAFPTTTFTFATKIASGKSYDVTVLTAPAGDTCTVTNGSNTVGSSNITNVAVSCVANTYSIGGTVSGLTTGQSVVLQDNGGDNFTVTFPTTSFTFATKIASGKPYKVTVLTAPAGDTCTVTNGSNTVGSSSVTNVAVSCAANTYTIGGMVSGLASGNSVLLEVNESGTNQVTVTSNTTFTFPTALASGTTYSVTVGGQPTGQHCVVNNAGGKIGTADVTNVAVVCSLLTYTIGGSVSGLNPSTSVVLLDNGGDSTTVSSNTTFTFPTALDYKASYDVTVGTQPSGENCTVTNGKSTVGAADVTNVSVSCTSNSYSIGGAVSGLTSGQSVVLEDNGGDDFTVTYPTTMFTFATKIASSKSYDVTVLTAPSGDTCSVTGGSGTVGSADITDVAVSCTSSGGGGGGGSYWIPYSAKPLPNTTGGSLGLFLIPSDKISATPAPTPQWVTMSANQLLALGIQYVVNKGIVSYTPQFMMYAGPDNSGNTQVWGLTLDDTSSVPKPAQIGDLSLPSTQQICSPFQGQTSLSDPTTVFVILTIAPSSGGELSCVEGPFTYEVVHYTDSMSQAPATVKINPGFFGISSIYQDGTLAGLYYFDSGAGAVDFYPDETFSSASLTQLVTGMASYLPHISARIADGNQFGEEVNYFSVTTPGTMANPLGTSYLYRLDSKSLPATSIHTGVTGSVAVDQNNLYFTDITSNTSTVLYQVAATSESPMQLYSGPGTVTSGDPALTYNLEYQLIGTNDSLLTFATSTLNDTTTNTTANLYTLPVGTASSSTTTLAGPFNNMILSAFLAPSTPGDETTNVLFVDLFDNTYNAESQVISETESSFSMQLDATSAPTPTANSVYEPLVLGTSLYSAVWQVTGITDTNGGWGTGTANLVDIGTLADTPFTTTGGGDYKILTGYIGDLASGLAGDNAGVGLFAPAAYNPSAGTLPMIGAAVDLTKNFVLPISLTNTNVSPY